ncbi:unnamed protein product [Adineta ricciae]|uniref:Uncharacterized protein n=1 Tax=Adineta ricciae TaxID=249248 RepID=A0A813RLE2_ADIRI|nr:unnamed protein product [Adineta ricciae]
MLIERICALELLPVKIEECEGDQCLNLLSDCVWRRTRRQKQGDVDDYSSDSLRVYIDDLANLDEMKKIVQKVNNRDEEDDSRKTINIPLQNIIDDSRVLSEFRQHSSDILAFLSQPNVQSYLNQYGEQDTGRKLLSIAAETGWYEGVVFLLNRHVNINETDRENRTALIDCLTSANVDILLTLVQNHQCNLNVQTLTGHTAAHYTVMMNKISFFDVLVKSGARLDLRNDKGENVLHHIIEYERKECWRSVKSFHRYHSYGQIYLSYLINSKTHENKTCLMLAFEHRPRIHFFKELLPYINRTSANLEYYRSWSKAYELLKKFILIR